MFRGVRFNLILAEALLLLSTQFGLALSGAGPYISSAQVKIGLALGIWLAYLAVLWSAMALSARVRTIQSRMRKNVMLGVIALAAGVATLLAPLLPSAVLALVCLSQSLCPDSANPILWGYLQLVTELPPLPFIAGFLSVLLSAALRHRPGGRT